MATPNDLGVVFYKKNEYLPINRSLNLFIK
mgnify:CR=1 FL=1